MLFRLLAIALLAAATAEGQPLDALGAQVTISIERDGSGTLTLRVPRKGMDATELESAIARGLPCSPHIENTKAESTLVLVARCAEFVQQRGFRYRARVSLTYLGLALHSAEVRFVEAEWRHPRAASDTCERHEIAYWLQTPQSPVEIDFGYSVPEIAMLFLPAMAFAFAAVGWVRSRARGASELTDVEFFEHWQCLRTIKGLTLAMWPWIMAWTVLHDRFSFLSHIEPPFLRATLVATVYLAGPALVGALCRFVAHPVLARRASGSRPDDFFWGALIEDATWMVPYGLVLIAFALVSQSPRTAAALLVGAFIATHLLAALLERVHGTTLHAVRDGELRARTSSLARAMRCELSGIFIVPDPSGQRMNAFAAGGGALCLTDSVIESLDKREVDAVVAHELSHLKHRDPSRFALYAQLGMVGAAGVHVWAWQRYELPFVWVPVALSLTLVAGFFGYQWLRRRSEWLADREAMEVLDDPHAHASSILKLTRKGATPPDWSPWIALTLSHPPARARASALLARPADAIEMDTLETYSARTDAPSVVFSTAHKRRILRANVWAATLVLALVPVASIALTGIEGVWAVVVGTAAALAALAVTENAAAVRGYRKLERELRDELALQKLPFDPSKASFVSLYPCDNGAFEGFFDWDIGLFALAPEGAFYIGERARFSIAKATITEIDLKAVGPAWYRVCRATLAWQDEDGAPKRTLGFAPAGARTLLGRGLHTKRFVQRLRRWAETPSPREPVKRLEEIPEPCEDARAVRVSGFVMAEGALWLMLLAALAGVMAGLDTWSVTAAASSTTLAYLSFNLCSRLWRV